RKALWGVLFLAATSAGVIFLYFGPEPVVRNKVWIMFGALAVFLAWLFLAFLKPEEKKPVAAIVVLFFFSIMFWMCYEQAGSSFNLFANDFTNRHVFGYEFPAGWYQSTPAFFVWALAPV